MSALVGNKTPVFSSLSAVFQPVCLSQFFYAEHFWGFHACILLLHLLAYSKEIYRLPALLKLNNDCVVEQGDKNAIVSFDSDKH